MSAEGKQTKRSIFEIGFFVLLILLIFQTVFLLVYQHKLRHKYTTQIAELKAQIDSKSEQTCTQKQAINRSLIVDWVYKHSSRVSRKQVEYIVDIALRTKYPLLVLSIIEAESNFNPCDVSKAGAIGLMQILPSDSQIKELQKLKIINNKRDLFDPELNIKAGVYILDKKLEKAKGSLPKALYYYVGGSKSYVNEVLRNLGELYLIAYTVRTEQEKHE